MRSIARIPALDGVRGLAALMVLLSHFLFEDLWYDRWWWPMAHSGWLGVDLFFVLSGFLITGILLGTKTRPHYFREFYRRRALRIFPLYYAVLLWSVFAIVVIDRAPYRLWQGYDSLGWYFAFLPNVALALKQDWLWQTNWAGLSHLWSLAVEEQYYIVWPFVVWLLPRRWLLPLCAGLLMSGVYLRELTDLQFGKQWSIASYVLPYCRMDGLAAGSLLAIVFQMDILRPTKIGHTIARDLTFISGMLLFYWLVAENSHWRGTFTAFFFTGFLYLALCENSGIQRLCNNAFLRHLGQYSYGLYVFHQMFRMVYFWYFREPLEKLGGPVFFNQAIYILLAFGATYLCARISWKYLEKPFLDKK